jgi:hypothetical protein
MKTTRSRCEPMTPDVSNLILIMKKDFRDLFSHTGCFSHFTKFKTLINDGIPSYSVIKNILILVLKKMVWLSMWHQKQKNLGQKREMAKKQLENIVSDFPQMSIRKAASAVGVSPALVYHIFTDDLHLKSFKVSFMV